MDMKEKLIKLLKKEIETRDEILEQRKTDRISWNLWLTFEFDDGEPTINVYENIKFFKHNLISIVCGEEYYLTKEESKNFKEFVREQKRLKIESKINKRLEKYGN